MKLHQATVENFNEIAYLLANIDVAIEVMEGKINSGFTHFVESGVKEGRCQIVTEVSDFEKDKKFHLPNVPLSDVAKHSAISDLCISIGGKTGMRVLEIGSRKVTGAKSIRTKIIELGGTYIGFDYHPGENVDIVGDAHKLSDYFNEGFDVIYSSAVFEHLAMPWVVATEVAKVLKVGGSLLIETHFSFSSHERPWHFFQFSDLALRALFSSALGFKCIEAGMCNPIIGRFSSLADAYLRRRSIRGLYCHSDFYGIKLRDVSDFDWSNLNTSEVVAESEYPKPRKS